MTAANVVKGCEAQLNHIEPQLNSDHPWERLTLTVTDPQGAADEDAGTLAVTTWERARHHLNQAWLTVWQNRVSWSMLIIADSFRPFDNDPGAGAASYPWSHWSGHTRRATCTLLRGICLELRESNMSATNHDVPKFATFFWQMTGKCDVIHGC